MAFNNKKVGAARYYGQQRDTSLNSFDPIMREKPLPIIIGNLAAGTTEDQIKRVFSNYGTLNNIFMLFDQALVQMETQISSESAKRELDGKCFRGQIISVKYATADSTSRLTSNHITTTASTRTPITRNHTTRRKFAVSVKDLSPMVSNELLAESFQIFGAVDRAVVIVNNKGESTRRGIVEFNNEQAAINAVQRIQEGSFLMTSSPRPISATIMEHEDSEVGLPEEKLPKSTQYYTERKLLPRFAESGTFEDLCANTWKVRYNLEREQRQQFDKNIEETRAVFELDIENCRRAMQLKQENPVEREMLEDQRQKEAEERKQNETARVDEHNKKMTESENRQKVLGNQIEKQINSSSAMASTSQLQYSPPPHQQQQQRISHNIPTRGASSSSNSQHQLVSPTQLTKQQPASHPITAGSSSRADKKRYKCPQCPKRYSHSCNLTTHMRIHDKERQVKCEICSKVFATKHQYMSHMITHSSTRNRKKFQQRQLQISARQQQQQQQETHKFLKCLECRGGGKYFRTPEALSVHMATCHKASISNEGNFSSRRNITYSCVYCDEKFTESEALRIHVTTHTENKYKFN